MFEFACERLIPGCTTKVQGEDEDDVITRAEQHMRDHHDRMTDAELRAELKLALMRYER